MINNYILAIDPNSIYNTEILKQQLDLCIDWTRLFACTYILHTTSGKEKLYSRFKLALPDSKFFIVKTDLKSNEYTGWLGQTKWERIKNFKTKND